MKMMQKLIQSKKSAELEAAREACIDLNLLPHCEKSLGNRCMPVSEFMKVTIIIIASLIMNLLQKVSQFSVKSSL